MNEGIKRTGYILTLNNDLSGAEYVPNIVNGMINEWDFPLPLLEAAAREITADELTKARKKYPSKNDQEIRATVRLNIIAEVQKKDEKERPEKYSEGRVKRYKWDPPPSIFSGAFWNQNVGRTGAGKIVSGLSVAELAVILGVLILVPGANVQAILALALVGVIGLAIGIPLAVTSTKTPTTTA